MIKGLFSLTYKARCNIYVCFVLLFSYKSMHAQNTPFYSNIELQRTTFKTPKPTDTTDIQLEIQRGIKLTNNNTDSAILLFTDVTVKSQILNYNKGTLSALMNLGACYARQGEFQKSLLYYRKALHYSTRGNYNTASLGMLYTSMGTYWQARSRYDSAAWYYYKAEQIIEGSKIKTANEASQIVKIHNNIGGLWAILNNMSMALTHDKKAAAVAIAFKDSSQLASIYNNIGAIYQKNYKEPKNIDTARRYYELATYYGQTHNQNSFRRAVINLSLIYIYDDNQPGKAIPLLEQVIQAAGNGKESEIFMKALLVLGVAYFYLHDYTKAEAMLLYYVNKKGNVESQPEDAQEAYNMLSAIYGQMGQYKEAFYYQAKSRDLLDTLKQRQNLKMVYELENRSRNAEKEKQLAESKLLISQQQNRLKDRGILIGGTSAGVLILSLALGGTIRHNRNKQRLQKQKIRNMEQSGKIEQLQAMMQGEEKERARIARELHDGVMSRFLALKLNIKSLKNDHPELEDDDTYRQVMQQVADAAEELRDTSHKLIPEILLHGLPEAIRSFCEKLNKTHQIKLDFLQYDPLPPLNYNFSLSVYRIVQELVQNIIKHSGATEAIIQINCTGGMMSLTIEDNGNGFNKDLKHDGAGLRNVRQRVMALNGSMDLQSDVGTGTAVYMEFEIQQLENELCSG